MRASRSLWHALPLTSDDRYAQLGEDPPWRMCRLSHRCVRLSDSSAPRRLTCQASSCSSVALTALGMYLGKPWYFVSQALNTTFHAPAPALVPKPCVRTHRPNNVSHNRGVKIEIVNTTVAFGARTVSTITEVRLFNAPVPPISAQSIARFGTSLTVGCV